MARFLMLGLGSDYKMLRFGVFDDNDKLLGQVTTFSTVFLQNSYVGCTKQD